MEYIYKVILIYFNQNLGMKIEIEINLDEQQDEERLDAVLQNIESSEHLVAILITDEDGIQEWFFTGEDW